MHAAANHFQLYLHLILVSIVVSIPACHAGERGSILRRKGGNCVTLFRSLYQYKTLLLQLEEYTQPANYIDIVKYYEHLAK